MTILGIKVDWSDEYAEEYTYYTVDINEDDHEFWNYYAEMRRESNECIEDYRRSNQHYPKLRNMVRSTEDVYDNLTSDRQLVASWVWV